MNRLTKNLDMKYTKYIVIEVIVSYSFWLNIPLGIYNIFYSKLL